MKHSEIVKAIQFIRPDAEFSLSGEQLTWLDKKQTQPTDAEIESGFIAYQTALKSEAKTKADAKAALLNRLGITAEEAVLLLS